MLYHPVLEKKNSTGARWGDVLAMCNGGYVLEPNHCVAQIGAGAAVLRKLIPEAQTQPKITPRSAILHTNAGARSARSLWGYITQSTVNGEPHFQVPLDGRIEQYMPLNVRADCNYSANRWHAGGSVYYGAISFETQDLGAATLNTTPWTFAQVRAMVGVLSLLSVVYGVHCTQPARWDASGIGHHSLFPFQGIGYKSWTNVRGKTCPGTARVKQMDHIRAEVARVLAEFSTHTEWRCPS